MTPPSNHAIMTEDSATSHPGLSPDRHRQTRTACAFRSTPHEAVMAAQTPDLTDTNDHQVGSPAAHLPRNTAADSESYPDWEAVYRDNVDRVYRLMFAKVGNRPDAEDLTAEVFLAALPPLRVSASTAQVRAYLLATARTTLARYWRRTLGQEITTLPDQDTLEAVPANPPASADTADRAAMILAQLPPSYRRILQLRFLESCSVREAAAALGVSVAAGKVLQHRALRRAAQLVN
jgi:RNA polymerase sigma factor (sigma-70 family)